MYEVIDAIGRSLELADDDPLPPGCTLRLSTMFMDAQQRGIMRNDEQRQKVREAYEARRGRLSRGMITACRRSPATWARPERAQSAASAQAGGLVGGGCEEETAPAPCWPLATRRQDVSSRGGRVRSRTRRTPSRMP